MKKIITLFLFVTLLLTCGCTKQNNSEENVLAGKTFYDSSDTYLAKEPSQVWFGTDGSFVLKDNYSGGYDEYSGAYEINKSVATLTSDNKEIKFEIKDENKITLKTTLKGCGSDSVFTTDKPTPSNNNQNNQGNSQPDSTITVYYNNNRKIDDYISYLELSEDGTFTLVDYTSYAGMIKVEGLYSQMGNVYAFSNFEEFNDVYGEKVYNFEFEIVNDDELVLLEDLAESRMGDSFKTTIPSEYPSSDTMKEMVFVHQNDQDMLEEYLPKLTINSDYSFVFYENCYSGFGEYLGYCKEVSDGWECYVTDASSMKGYRGEDVQTIIFKYNTDGNLVLQTQLCMSQPNDIFIKK